MIIKNFFLTFNEIFQHSSLQLSPCGQRMNVPEHLEYSYLLGVMVFLVQLVERFNSAKY